MKVTCKVEPLVRGVEIVQNCVSVSGAIPIISNILVEEKEGRLELTATNLEIGIRTSLEADVKEAGAVALLARKMSDIVRELPAKEVVSMETAEGYVALECGNSHFKVNSSNAEDFPRLQVFESEESFGVKGQELAKLIHKNIFAVSEVESRYTMNGLLMEFEGEELRVVGTDGRRLTYGMTTPSSGVAKEQIRCIVPKQAAREVARLFDVEGEVRIQVCDTQILFECGETVLISRLISGQFPDYQRVIPKDYKKEAVVNREGLLATCRRVGTMTLKERDAVKLTFEEGASVAAVSTPDVGEATEELVVEYKGDHIEVAYKVDYIVEVLKVIESDQVRIEFTTSDKAAVLRPVGDEDYLCVLMPMKY